MEKLKENEGKIIILLHEKNEPMTPKQISDELGLSYSTIRNLVMIMVAKELLIQKDYGTAKPVVVNDENIRKLQELP